jgi:hypothetical protein
MTNCLEAEMIRFLLFELEKTLVDGQGKVVAHVIGALKTMKSFRMDTGERPVMCLICEGSADRNAVDDKFAEMGSRLQTLGLNSFFDPIRQRVTLIEDGHVQRFDRHLFETVLSQSKSDATPDQCVFFTGDPDVARAARSLSIKTLALTPYQDARMDFTDWLESPLLVAKIVGSNRLKNTEVALRAYLAATESIDLVSLTATTDPDTFLGNSSTWQPITSEKLRDMSGINVKLPAEIRVKLDASGKVKTVERTGPAPSDREEAAHFVESLLVHGQIASESGLAPGDATHEIRTDSEGRRYLVRKRFTAV